MLRCTAEMLQIVYRIQQRSETYAQVNLLGVMDAAIGLHKTHKQLHERPPSPASYCRLAL